MENFIYSIPTKIYFGKGEENKVGELIKDYHPHKVLIHFGSNRIKKTGLLTKVEKALKKEKIQYVELGGVIANPTLSLVKKGIALAKKEKVDFVLAIGGGSVMDSAKAIANGVANPNVDVWDFSTKKKVLTKTIHKAAIVTIAASGSEMSDSCVISNDKTHEKKGLSSEFNRFDFSIENPELTYSVNKYQTACGAVDIAMHTIERYFCVGHHTEVTDEIALAVIKSTIECSNICLKNPNNYDGRANMMWASSLAHNNLTGLGRKIQMVVHQFEHELSGLYPEVAHGAGLAALWCSWARYVYKANLKRWKKYAQVIWGTSDILKAIKKQEDYYHKIGMPISLRELKVKKADLAKMALRLSMNKTRVLMGDKELRYLDMLKIYQMAY